ncbi:MAG: hypothetical protein ORN24_01725, partial [Burkholderiales bacterium]|nr:hypothetical protein [Burkholderiales bacterium]
NNTSAPKKRGLGYRIFNRYFLNAIDSTYKIYFVGFLFGLGFDTATEVSLLALTATSLLQNMNVLLILLLPIAFASGMVITDTVNSTFMSKIYTKVQNNQQLLKFYNYILLGSASCITLLVILIELTNYLSDQFAIHFSLITLLSKLSDYSEIIGSSIVGVFIILGIIIYSVLISKKRA